MRFVCVLLLLACGDSKPAATPTDTPTAATSTVIHGGDKKWVLTGGAKATYEAVPDPQSEGVTLVRPTGPTENRYVSLIKNFGAAPYIGKKAHITINVKTDGITGRAEVWARAVAPDSPLDTSGLGGAKVALEPTSAMKPYVLDLDVPAGTKWVQYGVGLAGPGTFAVGTDTIEAR